MRSRSYEPLAVKFALLAAVALFIGCGVTILLVKAMPRAFGASGVLILPGIVVVVGATLIVTSISAWIDRLQMKLRLLVLDFFLLGLLFGLYILYPETPTRYLVALVTIPGMPVLYGVVTYLSMRGKASRSPGQ